MSALLKIRQSGFDVAVIGDNQLAVRSAHNLTDNQRDFLKSNKSKIIDELLAEQIRFPKKRSGLKPEYRQKLLDYMQFIGEENQSMIQEYLDGCENNPLILQYQLEFIAVEMKPKAPAIEKMVMCGRCSHWRGHHQHQKGSGACAEHIQPLGACHWFDTPKLCDSFRSVSPT